MMIGENTKDVIISKFNKLAFELNKAYYYEDIEEVNILEENFIGFIQDLK